MAAQTIIVPNIGDFKEVEVIEVLVKEGQKIKKEESVITLESDKSSVEVPSNFSGVIKEINIKVGDKVSEGTTILSLDTEELIKEKTQPVSKNNNITTEKKSKIIDFSKKNNQKKVQLPPSIIEGETKPASDNLSDNGKAQNRRTEITLLKAF